MFWFVNPRCYNDAIVKKKTISEIFAEVSLETTVIPGGRRYGKGKKKEEKPAEVTGPPGVPYTPKVMTEAEWEKAEGVNCPLCGNNVMQLFSYGYSGEQKACKECIDKRRKLIYYKRDILASRR